MTQTKFNPDRDLASDPENPNLPPPEAIAQEMIEDLEAALEQLRAIAGDLEKSREQGPKEAKAS